MQTETAELWISTHSRKKMLPLSLSLPFSQSPPSKVRCFECNPIVLSPKSKTLQVLDDLFPLLPQLVLAHACLHIGDQLFDNGVVLGMLWTNDKFELLVRGLPSQVGFERVKLCLALSPRLRVEEDVCLFLSSGQINNSCIFVCLHIYKKKSVLSCWKMLIIEKHYIFKQTYIFALTEKTKTLIQHKVLGQYW